MRSIEPKADFLIAEATELLRVDPVYDCGITGGLEVAHIAEGFGFVTIPRCARHSAVTALSRPHGILLMES
jgi:hypothetical protein